MKFQLICLVALFAVAYTSPLPQEDKVVVPEVVTELKPEPEAKVEEAPAETSPEAKPTPTPIAPVAKEIENKQEVSEISAAEPEKKIESAVVAEIPIEAKSEDAATVAIVELKEETKSAPIEVIPETKSEPIEAETPKVAVKSEEAPEEVAPAASKVEEAKPDEAVRQVRETEETKPVETPAATVAIVEAVKPAAKSDAEPIVESAPVEKPALKTEEPAAAIAAVEEKALPATTEDLPAPVAKLAESEQIAVPESKPVDTVIPSEAAASVSDPTTSAPATATDGESVESNESPEDKISAESNESKPEA